MGLLGFALAHKAGMSYEKLVINRIAGPLQMADTVQTPSPAQEKRQAVGHRAKDEPVPRWTFDALAGCGALSSTAEDLIRFAEAQCGRIPTPLAGAMKRTQEKQISISKRMGIGLAFHILDLSDGRRIWLHDGATNGSSSFFAFSRSPQTAVVILCNGGPLSDAHKIDAFGFDLIRRLTGADEPQKGK
jgi:CubicO group peptidase (beta-lactamase class C family)